MICNKCKVDRNIEEYSFRDIKKQLRKKVCKICDKFYQATWYLKHKEEYLSRVYKRRKVLTKEHIALLSELKSKPCVDCKKTFHPICMDFDHLHDKISEVSKLARNGVSRSTLEKEIGKCEIVCANCHRLRPSFRKNSTLKQLK